MRIKNLLVASSLCTTLLFSGLTVHAATDLHKGDKAKTETNKILESSSLEGKNASYYTDEMKKVMNKKKDNLHLLKLYTSDSKNLSTENAKLDGKIEKSQNKLKAIQEQKKKKQQDIEDTQHQLLDLHKKIDKTQDDLDAREESFKQHIKSMKSTDKSTDMLEVILSSKNFGDMVNKLISYRTIVKADNQVIEEYITLSQLLENQKSEAETLLSSLQEKLSSLTLLEKNEKAEKEKLTSLKKQNEYKNMLVGDVVNELKKSNKYLEKKLGELKAKKKESIKLAELKEKALVAHTKALKEESVYKFISTKDTYHKTEKSTEEVKQGKIFITPATGRYTSGFEHRQLDGSYAEFHYGQDIANVTGTPIQAAADGEVIHASPMSTYGNVVFIKHHIEGTDYVTVYAHMSAIGVKVGDIVKQGETIGLVGSTGRVTGPHVHFEIQVGTDKWDRSYCVDPLEYIGESNSKNTLKSHKIDIKKQKEHEKKMKEQEKKIKEQNKKAKKAQKALKEYENYIEQQKKLRQLKR